MAITTQTLIADVELEPKYMIAGDTPARLGRCPFGAYIDDIFVLGTSKREVTKVGDRIFSALAKHRLPPKPSRYCRPSKAPVKVLRVASTSEGLIESSQDKLNKLLDVTHTLLNERS